MLLPYANPTLTAATATATVITALTATTVRATGGARGADIILRTAGMHLPALLDTKEKGMQFLIDNGVMPIFPGLFAAHVRT
jgi:hypothetical protein